LSDRLDLAISRSARWGIVVLLFTLLVFSPAAGAATLPASFADATVASGIDRPTSLSFTPDGRMLIGAEAGVVRVYKGTIWELGQVELYDGGPDGVASAGNTPFQREGVFVP
jgi:hypothetical protein